MAEGWASKLGAPTLTFASAAYFQESEDHLPISAMKEVNIDITHLQAKHVTPQLLKEADVIIFIYDFIQDEQPNITSFHQKKILLWNIPNPLYIQDPIEKWAAYQIACDQLADYVKRLKSSI